MPCKYLQKEQRKVKMEGRERKRETIWLNSTPVREERKYQRKSIVLLKAMLFSIRC